MSSSREMEEFEEFIGLSNLGYVPCKGKKYSLFGGDGSSRSRIGCFWWWIILLAIGGLLGNWWGIEISRIIVRYG